MYEGLHQKSWTALVAALTLCLENVVLEAGTRKV